MINVVNPATEEVIESYEFTSDTEIQNRIGDLQKGFNYWSQVNINDRCQYIHQLSKILNQSVDKYARLITIEMGKTLKESKSEVEKCVLLCNYYKDHAISFLEDKLIDEHAKVVYEPLGVIFGVMPWNFPLWQAFRFIIPAILAGNTVLLKHAENVPGTAKAIENLFDEVNFPCSLLKNVFVGHDRIDNILANPEIKAVSLTGSEKAGKSIAELAGKNLKKCVLELGGSDPFIVLEDANIQECIQKAITARLANAGQSCIAAKRFIVVQSKIDEFTQGLLNELKSIIVGNPLDEQSMMGPLARKDLLEKLQGQVENSIRRGAKLLLGGKPLDRNGYYYPPTVLKNVIQGMPAFDEELFGPVFPLIEVSSVDEAVEVANSSHYGLGASLWTKDVEKAKHYAKKLESGMVFINLITASHPKIPFGGIKNSGYGRELAEEGLKEFVNVKSIVF